jgi:hypothetical protein
MEQNYLLTYNLNDKQSYAWFYSEDEMNEFIECFDGNDEFSINEKLIVTGAKELE